MRSQKILEEKKKLGIGAEPEKAMKFTSSISTAKSSSQKEKVKIPPIRLLNEEGVQAIWNDLCEDCKRHCEGYAHLCGGRDSQHIMSD